MTAIADGKSDANRQVSPPRGGESVRLLLKVGITLTITALFSTLASYHLPGKWQPQDLVWSVALVASLGAASIGLMIVHHLTWDHFHGAVRSGAALLGLVSYVTVRLSFVALHGLYYRYHTRTPWVSGWTFSLQMTVLSVLCLWVCVLTPVVAAVISLRRRRCASTSEPSAPSSASAQDIITL